MRQSATEKPKAPQAFYSDEHEISVVTDARSSKPAEITTQQRKAEFFKNRRRP
jgi:hypothetical protein